MRSPLQKMNTKRPNLQNTHGGLSAPSPHPPSLLMPPPPPLPLLFSPSPRFSRYEWVDGGTGSHPLDPILPLKKHTVRQRTQTYPAAVHTTYAEYAVARCASRTCTISFTHVLKHKQASPSRLHTLIQCLPPLVTHPRCRRCAQVQALAA
jgi:hypothetical protein